MTSPATCYRPGCDARIYRLKHLRTGGRAPVDLEPHPDGNIVVDIAGGSYQVLAGDKLADARAAGAELHRNHWMTCLDPPERNR